MATPRINPKSVPSTVTEIPEPTETSALLPPRSSSQDASRSGRSPSCNHHDDTTTIRREEETHHHPSKAQVHAILSVLLIGVFLSQADTMLILANYPLIASELSDLSSGSWLLTSYMLAQCAAQPLYGKLSDIFGRKSCLQASYVLFALGSLGSGLGQGLPAVVACRAIQGLGGAGMVCVVSILITDLVPMDEVAQLRSYVNIVQTVGRASGAPLGGLLAGSVGWRWSFLVQVPVAVLALGLVQWKLRLEREEGEEEGGGDEQTSSSWSSSLPPHEDRNNRMWDKLRRVDFLGAFFMATTIFCVLMILDTGGSKIPWRSTWMYVLIAGAVVAAVGFFLTARFYATEPIFPLELMSHYVVATNYALLFLQNLVATAILFAAPLYFQVLEKATTAEAGLYLIPSIVGNTVGGLATGYWIKKTGWYKPPIVISPFLAVLGALLMVFLWKADARWPLCLLLFPLGLATGAIHSAAFVALTSGVAENEIAIAGSGMYLSGSVGGVVGISASDALFQGSLRAGLSDMLQGWPDKKEVMRKVLADVSFAQHASRELRAALIPAYVGAFQHVFLLALVAAAVSGVVACIIKGKRLSKK